MRLEPVNCLLSGHLRADMSCGPQFVVRTARHPRFERRGADLHLNATISLVDALVGFSTEARAWLLVLCSLPLTHISQASNAATEHAS